MAASTSAARPLQTLRDEVTALEASILECLAKPRKRSVHHLRTTTRRIEAQLELISLLPHLPSHKKCGGKAVKLLAKIRQAAGKVRDLDVQGDLIRKQASRNARLRSEAVKLRKILVKQRASEADSLLEVLSKQESKLPVTLGELNDVLKPAESIELSESSLIDLVQTWYAENVPAAPPGEVRQNDSDVEHLHNIRKKAKLARYLAESAPKDATKARRLAARYEALQEAGGEWHDWLLLAQIATDNLGKSSKLAAHFHANAARSLQAYQRKLAKKF